MVSFSNLAFVFGGLILLAHTLPRHRHHHHHHQPMLSGAGRSAEHGPPFRDRASCLQFAGAHGLARGLELELLKVHCPDHAALFRSHVQISSARATGKGGGLIMLTVMMTIV